MSDAFSYLLLSNHGKNDVSNLPGQSLPLVFILFVTLLQHKDEHLQHLQHTSGREKIGRNTLKLACKVCLNPSVTVPDGVAQV